MKNEDCLIIFTKNLILGTVKTRIGKEKGDEIAFEVYKKLLHFTKDVASKVDSSKIVYFNHHIEEDGIWSGEEFGTAIQAIGHLGMKMSEAFENAFKDFKKVIIIGSDCAEITEHIIQEAFDTLDDNDVVLGPAEDGGYYLIGMKTFYPFLFQDMPWSQEKLFQATMKSISKHNLDVKVLDTQSDIDYWKDWQKLGWKL